MLRLIQKVGRMVKVLLVDDDPAAHETLRLVLPDSFVLLSACCARVGPDVILLDITLPDGDGLHALRQIVARPVPPPVVMLTASTTGQRRVHYLEPAANKNVDRKLSE